MSSYVLRAMPRELTTPWQQAYNSNLIIMTGWQGG